MSLPTLTGTAKLITDPRKQLTKTDQPMATAILKFSAWRKVDGKWEEGEGVIAAAIAFEDVARSLASFVKGNDVTVAGTVTLGMWQDKPQVRLTLTSCAAAERKSGKQAVAA